MHVQVAKCFDRALCHDLKFDAVENLERLQEASMRRAASLLDQPGDIAMAAVKQVLCDLWN